jgi:RES domain-containing protein
VWRLGHRDGPLDYVPRHLCSWQHRWDDPRREYRTLYCAKAALTCLREVLADFRPNAKAIAEIKALFGEATPALAGVGEVAAEWRGAHELWPALAVSDEAFCDPDGEVELRTELEHEHAALLALHDMDHLDIAQVRSRDRIVTQTVGRELYERRYAGVRFGSNLDDQACYALFEGRAELAPNGEPAELTPELEPLRQVCEEFGLSLV